MQLFITTFESVPDPRAENKRAEDRGVGLRGGLRLTLATVAAKDGNEVVMAQPCSARTRPLR